MSAPRDLRLGPVHLTVRDLERSVAFYEGAIGLTATGTGELGAGGEPLLVLHEDPAARPAGRHAGLYHVALRFPARTALAEALARLAGTRTPLTGASDHGVSEALYLDDPDGNGLELYADRPRDEWPPPTAPGDSIGIFTAPLDLPALLGDARPEPRADPGLVVGHLHLHVSDLEGAEAFYAAELGLEVMARYPGAAFLAAGGYHHHLGVNVWRGRGVPPAPGPEDHVAGLREWTVLLPDGPGEGGRVLADPSGNRVRISPA